MVRRVLLLSVSGIFLVPVVHFAHRLAYKRALQNCSSHIEPLSLHRLADPVLIIAPHPDDESAGCGGLINLLVRKGRDPYVAIITDGDAFYYAWKIRMDGLWLSKNPSLPSSQRRLVEVKEALTALGLPESHIILPGFRERSIAQRWLVQCDKEVLSRTVTFLRQVSPKTIIVPSRYDDHPIHCVVSALSWSAILHMSRSHQAGFPVVLEYLIHYGNFPVPQGLKPDLWLLPPSPLVTSNHWLFLPLSEEAKQMKQSAIACHKSQLLISGRLLKSFVRINELYLDPIFSLSIHDRRGEPRSFIPALDIVTVGVEPIGKRRRGKLTGESFDLDDGPPLWRIRVRIRGIVAQSVDYFVHVFDCVWGKAGVYRLVRDRQDRRTLCALARSHLPMVITAYTTMWKGRHLYDVVPLVVTGSEKERFNGNREYEMAH